MIRWLLQRKFHRSFHLVLYISPIINVGMCAMLFSQGRSGDPMWDNVKLAVMLVAASFGIAVSLRRFVMVLRKPFARANVHVALASILTTITFFAVIYSLIDVFLPNSFNGIDAATTFDQCINAVYFSAITFTTVGYGDIHPVASLAKIFVLIETLSFFIFFVVLASNHRTFVKIPAAQAEPANADGA